MLKYSHAFFPSAPILEIELRNEEGRRTTNKIVALIDTGADASFAPLEVLEEIQAPIGQTRKARSKWGERRTVTTFIVDILIHDSIYPGIEVVGYEGSETLLGRDVLNRLWLSLDGPRETTEILTRKRGRKSV
jgi:predicted aspartyl protease